MPALVPTDYYGTITWLGVVPDRMAGLMAVPRQALTLGFGGPEGESHSGLTRPSCSRVLSQHPRETVIRNTRQLCVMSLEELATIAANMGIEALDPSYMGATLVIEGIPDFTHLPPSARLQGSSGATIVIDMENRPCMLPAPGIEADMPGVGKAVKTASKGLRGVTAWVEREGVLALGEQMRLHVPEQRGWVPGLI